MAIAYSCSQVQENRLAVFIKEETAPPFFRRGELPQKKVNGIVFDNFSLIGQRDTISGYWGMDSCQLFFINNYDLDCGRLIPFASFCRDIDTTYTLINEKCIVERPMGLKISSKVLNRTDSEVIVSSDHTSINHLKPKYQVYIDVNEDSVATVNFISREEAFYEISSTRGFIRFHKVLYGDSTVYLPY
ncbi:MAG: hypothetical protein JXR03_04915 [Cyclobacteriaceae bacterium]